MKILEYDRIDISEGIDLNWSLLVFLHQNFSYGPYLCDGCYNMTQKSIDSKNIDIVYFKGDSYRIHFWYVSKNKCKRKRKAISLMTLI